MEKLEFYRGRKMEFNYHYEKFCHFLGIKPKEKLSLLASQPENKDFLFKNLITYFFPLIIENIVQLDIKSLVYFFTEQQTQIKAKIKTTFHFEVKGDKKWLEELELFSLPTLYPEGSFYLRSRKVHSKPLFSSTIKCSDEVLEKIPIGQIIKAPGPHLKDDQLIIRPYYGRSIYIKISKGSLRLSVSGCKGRLNLNEILKLLENQSVPKKEAAEYLLIALGNGKNPSPYFHLSPLGRKRLNEFTSLNIAEKNFLTSLDLYACLLIIMEVFEINGAEKEKIHEKVRIYNKPHPSFTDPYDLKGKFIRTYPDYLITYLAPYFYSLARTVKEEINLSLKELEKNPSLISNLLYYIFARLNPSSHILSSLFNKSNFIQIHKRTNPVQDYEHRLKLTFLGQQGIQNKQARCLRDIHESYRYRICPVEIHQGVDAGLNCYLAKDANLDENNQILSSPEYFLSPASLLVPFIEYNDGARIMMGINNIRQAVSLENPEVPLIQTGYEKEIGKKVIKEWGNNIQEKRYGFTGWSFESYLHAKRTFKDHIPAIGVNLLTAFMFWEGYTFEDGVVLSETAAKKLTTAEVITEHFVIWGDEYLTNKLDCLSKDEKGQLDENGIIKQGKEVKPNDIIIGRIKEFSAQKKEEETTRLLRELFGARNVDFIEVPIRAREDFYGKVIEVKVEKHFVSRLVPYDQRKRLIKHIIRIRLSRKRPVRLGDKLANRHGNKGIVSLILPDSEMPHLPDGTPVEIILNPIGVIARMNIGQLLEAHFSWLAKYENTPLLFKPFEIIDEQKWQALKETFKHFQLDEMGRTHLKIKGEYITDFPVTVGYVYTLRLYHIAEDKANVRSVSAYSAVTQQPFQGKKRLPETYLHGGQRFGEMEVWAAEAHYVPNLLKEMLTKKSDNLILRKRLLGLGTSTIYQDSSVPHSLRNIVVVLRALGIELYGKNKEGKKIDLTGENNNEEINSLHIHLIPPEDIPNYTTGILPLSDNWKELSRFLELPQYFGPEKNYQCECGRITGKINEDKECPTCGVICGNKNFYRSILMGCIELPVPLYDPFLIKNKRDKKTYEKLVFNFWSQKNVNYAELYEKQLEFFKSKSIYWHFIAYLPILPVNLRIKPELNQIYKQFIYRVARFSLFLRSNAPSPILANEQLKLQNKLTKVLEQVWALLPGKFGLIRRYLLGKRVDFSGRLVCIPDQTLDVDTIGLSADFLRKLAKPFLSPKELKDDNTLVEKFKNKVILLIRFPTLHKMNVQAFYVKISPQYRNVIGIPPIICAGFNADFDGDEFSVHLPISENAQKEAREKCMIHSNWFSPANGSISPLSLTKEIVAGIFYLTFTQEGRKKLAQALNLSFLPQKPWNKKELIAQTEAFLRNPDYSLEEKKQFLKAIQNLGFYWAQKAGFTANYFELRQLYEKNKNRIENLFNDAFHQSKNLLEEQIITIWDNAQSELKRLINQSLNPNQSLYYLFVSGADKKTENLAQVVGFRGIIGRLGGKIIPTPVKGNLINGLDKQEFFICAFGARKGVVEKKLATSDSGYIARQMVEATHPLRIVKEDCCVQKGLSITSDCGLDLGKFVGRYLAKPLKIINEKSISTDKPLSAKDLEVISKQRLSFKIRSPLFCKCDNGVCQKCYGLRPGWQVPPEIGYPIGILAAETITEPATQLALRSFHQGGVAGHDIVRGLPELVELLGKERKVNSQELLQLLKSIQDVFEYFGQNIFHIHFELLLRAMMPKYLKNFIYPLRQVVFERDGFLSAMAYERQIEVISQAAINSKKDILEGLKEKIILGRKI